MVFKVFNIGNLGKEGTDRISDIPLIADETDFPTVTVANVDLRWQVTDAADTDQINTTNWNKIIEIIDSSCNLKNEDDLKSVIIVAPFWAPILESRRQFLEQVANEEGIGPKRLKLIRRMLEIWVPFTRKAKVDKRQQFDNQTFRPGPNNDRFSRGMRPPRPQNAYEFLRWIKL